MLFRSVCCSSGDLKTATTFNQVAQLCLQHLLVVKTLIDVLFNQIVQVDLLFVRLSNMTAFSQPHCIGLYACTVQSILLLFLSKSTETFSSIRLFMRVCCAPGSLKLLQLQNAKRSSVNSAHSESVTRSLPMSTDAYWSSLHNNILEPASEQS